MGGREGGRGDCEFEGVLEVGLGGVRAVGMVEK